MEQNNNGDIDYIAMCERVIAENNAKAKAMARERADMVTQLKLQELIADYNRGLSIVDLSKKYRVKYSVAYRETLEHDRAE